MEDITDIRIRAFRAIDDPKTCLKYIEGHRKVLAIYGIENITTNTNDWMYSSAIFVVVVESLDGTKLYGGARLQAANGIIPLPIEYATGDMDNKIYDVVRYYSQFGAGELSGLWNSKEVSGLGIGSFFPARTCIVIAEQVGLNTAFCLCSPVTVRFTEWIGGRVLKSVGNEGTFYYPKIDLLATALILDDVGNLPYTHPKEREKMIYQRQNPECILTEKTPFHNSHVNIHYNLSIPSADKNEFKLNIGNQFSASIR